ncbi:hypothetical protein TRFO_35359 [Tritrichomonas foetus]|uniref:Uncharacterized protein n=1 Tax=Tritrichomonas foetus TaxID=1144522 RepID=A0A1J4JHR3_9EUKA|nr:hypothetical protein TRFO_35359 [Tritrichomonas foetus]|eukprot:OHS98265.1 hypothetical protein TRFO_35359 [Tritrichomonas foetus]
MKNATNLANTMLPRLPQYPQHSALECRAAKTSHIPKRCLGNIHLHTNLISSNLPEYRCSVPRPPKYIQCFPKPQPLPSISNNFIYLSKTENNKISQLSSQSNHTHNDPDQNLKTQGQKTENQSQSDNNSKISQKSQQTTSPSSSIQTRDAASSDFSNSNNISSQFSQNYHSNKPSQFIEGTAMIGDPSVYGYKKAAPPRAPALPARIRTSLGNRQAQNCQAVRKSDNMRKSENSQKLTMKYFGENNGQIGCFSATIPVKFPDWKVKPVKSKAAVIVEEEKIDQEILAKRNKRIAAFFTLK